MHARLLMLLMENKQEEQVHLVRWENFLIMVTAFFLFKLSCFLSWRNFALFSYLFSPEKNNLLNFIFTKKCRMWCSCMYGMSLNSTPFLFFSFFPQFFELSRCCSGNSWILIMSFSSSRPWPMEALLCVVGMLSGSGLSQQFLSTMLHGKGSGSYVSWIWNSRSHKMITGVSYTIVLPLCWRKLDIAILSWRP